MDAPDASQSAGDRLLGALMRILWLAIFALGGAWLAARVPLFGGHSIAGAAVGLAVMGAILLKEKALAGALKGHAAPLTLIVFIAYAAILACATYSEIFGLGWFDWLPG